MSLFYKLYYFLYQNLAVVVIFFGFICGFSTYSFLDSSENDLLYSRYDKLVATELNSFNLNVSWYLSSLLSLEPTFSSFEMAEPDFINIYEKLSKRLSGLNGLFWIPQIDNYNFKAYQKKYPDYFDAKFEFLNSDYFENTDYFFPILLASNSSFLGLDLYSIPKFKNNFKTMLAFNQDYIFVSKQFFHNKIIKSNAMLDYQFLIFIPVYLPNSEDLKGILIASIDFSLLISNYFDLDIIHGYLINEDSYERVNPFFLNLNEKSFQSEKLRLSDSHMSKKGLSFALKSYPTDAYLETYFSYSPYIFGFSLFFVSLFVSFYIYKLQNYSRSVELSVRARTNELFEAKKMLETLSFTDSLTELYNRRYFDLNFKLCFDRLLNRNHCFTVFMIDIDFFKQYNDYHGHLAGDESLLAVANLLQSIIELHEGIICRYGGEEFVAYFELDLDKPSELAKTCLDAVERLNIFAVPDALYAYVTISIGVVSKHISDGCIYSDFISLADEALYIAKDNGRNRFHIID